MFIAECDVEEVKKEASKLLKSWDVKHRCKKFESKPVDKKETHGIFKIRLEKLRQKKVKIQQYHQHVTIPAFVVNLCNYLRENINTDGIFRKPGVANRQRELKQQVMMSGGRLRGDCEHNPADVADLLKLFFRELPEPCIPHIFHDILQRCLEVKEKQKEAILLALLFFPTDYLYTLAYIMQFLQEVAAHQSSNRMDIHNLAIVWTPNLMPLKTGQVNDKHVLEKRLVIIQMLIENASLIGVVPECLYDHLSCQPSYSGSSHDELESSRPRDKNKKRRSGSLTRMLSGIKKMVRRSGSVEREATAVTPDNPILSAHTPRIMSTGKKRKASESNLPVFSAKKRREVLEFLPHRALLPDICTHTHLTPRILVAQPLTRSRLNEENEPKPRSCFYIIKTPERERQKSHSGSRLRFSHFGLGRKHKKKTVVMEDSGLELSATPNTLDVTSLSDDYVRISRSEYEDIKNRVTKIESRISSEFENIAGVSMSDLEMTPDKSELGCVHTVQSAYEKTLESAEKFSSPVSDELARRFSRDLQIRWSSEKKVIRSPSARKIGSLRRRSKDNVPQVKKNLSLNMADEFYSCKSLYPVNGLCRGKPNTVCNGLREPYLFSSDKPQESFRNFTNQLQSETLDCQRESLGLAFESGHFDLSSFGILTRSQTRRASSFHGCDLSKVPTSTQHVNNSTPVNVTEWKNAEDFLNEEKTEEKSVTGRPSVAKIRSQNAGMVLAKAKLFNTIVDSNSNDQTSIFKTSKSSSGKPQEIKKRNSSKSSKERKLQRKDSRNGGRRYKRENSDFKKSIGESTKIDENVSSRANFSSDVKENLMENKTLLLQKSLPKTPLQGEKSTQCHLKITSKSAYNPGKQSNKVDSPLREHNKINNLDRFGSRFGRQQTCKNVLLVRSQNVAHQMSKEGRASPVSSVSLTPRRSPRLLLLKSRNLSKPV